MLYSKSWNIISLSILTNTVTSSIPIIIFSYMSFRSNLYIPLAFTVIVLLFLNKKLSYFPFNVMSCFRYACVISNLFIDSSFSIMLCE